jgi:GDPmannose 4,6-dehydratase
MKVVIFGAKGQDGRILFHQASTEGHEVLCIGSSDSANPLNAQNVASMLKKEAPDQIFYFPAYHRSSEEAPKSDVIEWERSFLIHLHGWLNVLDSVKNHVPKARVLYASSAHIFGIPSEAPQTELTPFRPNCPYGCSKLAGMQAGEWYRRVHGLFISHAILYPHESIYRSDAFLSKKLLLAAREASRNPKHTIRIGDPEAVVDWGYASEYTQAMSDILFLKDPNDFVISTGHTASVSDFAREIFSGYGLDWRNHVLVDPSILTKPKRKYVGDSRKLFHFTGRRPRTHLPDLAQILVRDFEEPI